MRAKRCGGDHAAAFRAYEAAAAPRVAQCRRVTAFTELLAAPAGPLAEGARNAMALVPAPINGFVFDYSSKLRSLPSRASRRQLTVIQVGR